MVNKNYIVMGVMFFSIIACSEKEQEETSKFESNPITESVGSNEPQKNTAATQVEEKMTYEECRNKNMFKGKHTITSEVLCHEFK